jgi:uncharacterized protein YprB with RNaseH-like and TPR domain
MGADDLRKRIEALNKKPLNNVPDARPEEPPDIKALRRKLGKVQSRYNQRIARAGPVTPKPPDPIVYSRTIPAAAAPPQTAHEPDPGPPVALEDAVEGIITEAPHGPGYYHIELPAHDLEADSLYLHRRFVSLTGHPDGQAVERLAAVRGAERITLDEVIFLDIETTGLGMTPLFLIGTMECLQDGFHFRQYFARDYSEEGSVIAAVSERLAQTGLLVTFNGKSFDVPFIQNRATATGVRLRYPESHLDILHEARRCYRRDLPNCRLQTLEQMVCGRCREDDIPSAEIPQAYHEFVRTGNANRIRLILQHNLYDLLTMADLMSRMWGRDSR